jgi:uncharacterized protein
LLDIDWLDIFAENLATIAISCDGPGYMNDRHRLDRRGRPTSATVEKAIKTCLSYKAVPHVFNGVLAVVDPNNYPRETVRYFYELGVPIMDLLLPDANHAYPPIHIESYSHTKLLNFMLEAFSEWLMIDDPRFRIRTFETFIKAFFGEKSELDAFGGDLSSILVIESDGSYRLLDVLSVCEEGRAFTGMHLSTHRLDEFRQVARASYPEPAETCFNCPAFLTCGGGYLPHRFDGHDYRNPSFYCSVLYGLHHYIQRFLTEQD